MYLMNNVRIGNCGSRMREGLFLILLKKKNIISIYKFYVNKIVFQYFIRTRYLLDIIESFKNT